MARDVKGTPTCNQSWQQTREGAQKLPCQALPRGWPGEVIAMDLFGPLPITRRRFSRILVIFDPYPGDCRPLQQVGRQTALKRAETPDVADISAEEWILRLGVPRLPVGDSGPHFIAEIPQRPYTSIGAREIFSTPYHHQDNSAVESFVRTLKKALGAIVDEDGKDWAGGSPWLTTPPRVLRGFPRSFWDMGEKLC